VAKTRSGRAIKIFYAWQNDLPPTFNRHAIKKGLRFAGAELEGDLSTKLGEMIEIVIDEATRDLPGSPHIPTAILQKIQAADVFVADVSAINSEQLDEDKKTPNPNVVFELGHAVAHLGWERVLLLVNEVHGSVKSLPFDFDRQRASPFRLADGGIGSQKDLTKMLRFAISLILEKDPPRPRASHFDLAEAQRERDLTNLRWFLQSIHLPTIDDHIETGPKFLSMASANFFDEVSAIISSSAFHLYDQELKGAVINFVKHWHNSMKYDHYTPMIGARSLIFTRGHPSDSPKEQRDWDYMDRARGELRKSTDSLLDLIRAKFPEIDIQGISNATGARYDAQMAEMQQRFAGSGKLKLIEVPAAKASKTKGNKSKPKKST
jgi:hypothetical protein